MTVRNKKKIPYGISDFNTIRTENYYYVDKTGFLSHIEAAGKYLFFIRPRRFGKSLLLSMMDAYYDVLYKNRFQELFKGTDIYKNPSEEQGKYLVLSLNFSHVDANPGKIETSFLNHIQTHALSFLNNYKAYLPARIDFTQKKIEESQSAPDILSLLMSICKESEAPVYIIIDEYDNFADTVLSTSGEPAYNALTHGEGILRSFFNVVKGGTTGMDAPIKRLFITGVSPITMDDVTSGFNIGKNVSLRPNLNPMLGFTTRDVEEIVRYYCHTQGAQHDIAYLMQLMTDWYGNYRFSQQDDRTMFNSDMVLYFIDNYLVEKKIPGDLVDRNVRVDYGKLRHLIVIDRNNEQHPMVNGNFNKLKQIIEDGETSTQLKSGFPLKKLTHPENFKSLLFYFGLLTIKGSDLDDVLLEIPNETVRRLFYDYIKEAYEETGIFSLDFAEYSRLLKGLAGKGQWKPLFDYLTLKMEESISLRDLITAEKTIQTFLNVYLGLTNLYIIHSEKELKKGYADLVMEPFLAHYNTIKYSCILEIKYLKSGAKKDDTEVTEKVNEAKEQIKTYAMDKKFKQTIGKTTLIKLVLVFSGHKVMYMGEA